MLVRNRKFHFNLTEEERDELRRRAAEAGMSMGSYACAACLGTEIKAAPPAGTAELVRRIRKAECALESIAERTRSGGEADWRELGEAAAELRSAEKKIAEAYGY